MKFLTPGVKSLVLRYLLIFAVAFAAQMVATVTTNASISTLVAAVSSAAAAGLVAVFRAISQISTLELTLSKAQAEGIAFSPVEKSKFYSVGVTVVATFFTIVGAGLVTGLYGANSFPGIVDVVVSAITAGVSGVVTYLVSFIPTPAA